MRLFDLTKTANSPINEVRKISYGKVVSVNYNIETPDDIGSIEYQFLTDIEGIIRGQAFPLFPFLKQPPLIDETVVLLSAPSEVTTEENHYVKTYYITSVNMWNHPHHGAITETKQAVTLGADFPEVADVNPMLPFEGDTILEGRLGQSIRFSQTVPGKTPWTGSASGTPIIAITNGQVNVGNGFEFVSEEINTDYASIYLTSNQQIPLQQSYTKTTSFDTPPTTVPNYNNNQVLISSGRVYLNASTERVLINGAEGVGLAGQTLNLDATKSITLDAPEIYLLANAKDQSQHAVLGDSLVNEIDNLYSDLQNVLSELGVLASAVNYLPMVEAASTALANLEGRQKKLRNKLLSKRIYLSK
jgi:hypothetical protein